jgi:hypothetical protein
MAPQQDKTVSEKKEGNKYKVDVVQLPKKPEKLKEEKEAAEKHAKKKTEIKEESVKVRTETKLEVLAEQEILKPDTQTQETIDAIDVEKISEEREANEALELIGGVAVTILSKFFDNGVEINAVDTIEEFKVVMDQVMKEARFAKLREKISSIPEQAALRKLKETLLNPESLLYKKLSKDWPTFISKSKEVYKDSSEGPASKAWAWAKENPGKIALAIVGAYALYNLFFKKKSEKEKEEEKDKNWTERLFNKDSILALGVLTIGTLVGSKQLREWLSENVIGEAKAAVLETADKVKEASINWLDEKIHFSEMLGRLKSFSPKLPEWLKSAKLKKIAEDMGITQENTESWKKYATPGGALMLLSDWGRKMKIDKGTKDILEKFIDREKKKETSEEQIQYISEDYGEMAPAKEALKNYSYTVHKDILDPIVTWAKEHPATLTIAGAYLAQYEVVRSAATGGLKFSAESMWQLAKLPFKTVKNFPLSTLFVVSAVLLMKDDKSITDAAGNIMVPKDPENLKKYIKQRMIDTAELTEELPGISDEDIDTAVELIRYPDKLSEYFGDVEDMLLLGTESISELVALTPEESLEKANRDGLSSFLRYLRTEILVVEKSSFEHGYFSKLITDIELLHQRTKLKERLSKEDFEKINENAINLNIKIFFEDGFVKWAKYNYDMGVPILVEDPRNLAVDPSLNHKEATEKAKHFTVEDSFNVGEFTIGRLRTLLSEIVHEDIETEEEAKEILNRKIRRGELIFAFAFGKLFIIEPAKGIVQKYILGWANPLFNLLDGEFSVSEAAYDYADGLVSVMFLGTATSLAKLDFIGAKTKSERSLKNRFGNLLWRSALYPISGPYGAFTAYRKARSAYQGDPDWFRRTLSDKKSIIVSDLKAVRERWSLVMKKKFLPIEIFNTPYMHAMEDVNNQLINMNKARKLIIQAQFEPKKGKTMIEEATNLLEGTVKEHLTALWGDRKELLAKLDKYIIDWEKYRRNVYRFHKLHQARMHLENGNILRATRCMRKAGASEDIPFLLRGKENIEKTLQALDQRIAAMRSKIKSFKVQKSNIGEKFLDDYEKGKTLEAEPAKPGEYPSVHEQEAHAQEAKKINEEIVEIERQKQAELTEARNRAAENGEALTSKSVEKRLAEIEARHNEKLIQAFEKRQVLIGKISPEILAKHKLEIPRSTEEMIESLIRAAKASKRSKISTYGGRLGRGLGAAILGLAVGIGAAKGIEWLKGENEVLDLEAIYRAESKEEKEEREEVRKRFEEEPELNQNIMLQIQDHLRSVRDEYNEFFLSIFNPQKLKNMPESELIRLVNEFLPKHAEKMERLKKFLTVNREAIVAFYKTHPDVEERNIVKKEEINLFAIGYDEDSQRPYLKYASEADFKEAVYEKVDAYRKYIDKLIEGKQPSTFDHAWDIGTYVCPIVGTYRDGHDTYNAIRRGDWETAAWSGAWTVIGGVADVLLVSGIGSAAGAGLRGIRGTVGVTRGAVKGAEVAKETSKLLKAIEAIKEFNKLHYGKVAVGAMGADLGRHLVKPELNEKYEF